MLRIHFGSLPKEIYNTEVYYEHQYDKEWVMDEFARRVIRDIDASAVLSPDVISNDIFRLVCVNRIISRRQDTTVNQKHAEQDFQHLKLRG